MPFRFRRSKKIMPGVRLNIGKRGPSVSVGGRGGHVTVGRTGLQQTVSAPGTGVSYTTKRSGCGARMAGLSVLVMAGLIVLACGGGGVIAPAATATRKTLATVVPTWTAKAPTQPSPVSTQGRGEAKPAPTVAATDAPVAPTAAVRAVSLPVSDCECDGDRYNCDDFGLAGAEAQACYQHCMDIVQADVHHLDADEDGLACEWDG